MDVNVQQLAEDIAAHLPEGWRAGKPVESDWGPSRSATIEHRDGPVVSLYWDSYRKHVSCSGRYPLRDGNQCSPSSWGALRYDETEPRIRFSPTRKPQALARDIERRLLAQYLPLYRECLRLSGEHAAAEEDRDHYLKRYATACGGEIRGETIHVFHEPDDAGNRVMGDVRVSTDGSARFEVYVPADMVERICQILGGAR